MSRVIALSLGPLVSTFQPEKHLPPFYQGYELAIIIRGCARSKASLTVLTLTQEPKRG
jgi:hypothetical protein